MSSPGGRAVTARKRCSTWASPSAPLCSVPPPCRWGSSWTALALGPHGWLAGEVASCGGWRSHVGTARGGEAQIVHRSIPPPSLGLHSASFAASCTLMALASRDTKGEMSGPLCPHKKRMGGMNMDVHPRSCPWPPWAPQVPSCTPLLPSSVSIDIPGTVPEWLWWHLPNILFTHGEYDRPWLDSRAPGVGGVKRERGQ